MDWHFISRLNSPIIIIIIIIIIQLLLIFIYLLLLRFSLDYPLTFFVCQYSTRNDLLRVE